MDCPVIISLLSVERHMRIIGLDYGTKTVGVAISDEGHIIASPHSTIERKHPSKLRQTYAAIEQIIMEKDVGLIVVGLPKNMNNTQGERAADTRAFGEKLEQRTGLEVVYVDERLTTVQADRILEVTNVPVSGRKEHIDKMAAAIILQTYLDMNNTK